ncbi:hypothetical protein ACO2Q3_07270 [Caulobacter sp. KR2-114]|uniref:hypothetical protein n=1 Tax=Caulobacter sp. KR2-114 TaxID=3400912 RepID=UPI003C1081C7
MTRSLCLGAVATLLALPAVAATACGPAQAASATPAPGLAPDIVAAAQRPQGFPSFCSIPKMPTDVRGVAEWKAAVLDIRQSGAALQRQTAPGTWSLDGSTSGFAAESRGEAEAPPPMTPATPDDTAAFARQLKDRATPPPRPR